MGLRYNPPPGWPPAPAGFTPEPGWQPDPSWPAPPPGWQLWVSDDQPAAAAAAPPPWAAQPGPAAQFGDSSSRETGGRPEPRGVFLTDGSYDDDSFYSSPVGAADPGDFAAAAHPSDAPAHTAVYDSPPRQPGDAHGAAPSEHDTPPGRPSDPFGTPPASYSSPPGRASDPYRSAVPGYDSPPGRASDSQGPAATAYDTPPSHSDLYAGAPTGYDRPPAHPGDRYAAPATSYDSPAGGFGAPAPGYDATASNPYGGTSAPAGPGGPGAPGGPGGPAGPGAQYGTSQETLPGATTSGWATVSLMVGICCGAVIGAVLGVIALGKIRRTGQRGSLQATCGIVLSAFWTLLLVVIIVVVSSSPGSATRGANGQISNSGKLNVFSLAVGDCFDNPASQQDIASVTAVPCAQPHNAQVFASFDLPGSDSNYPGNLTQLASNGCNAQQDRLNQALVTDSMSVRFIYPVLHAWQSGERTVTCLVVTPTNVSASLLNH